jgi:ABC-type branched-subunit amino acid transport system ATPase component
MINDSNVPNKEASVYSNSVLQVDDVHAGYGKSEILNGVSLSICPGEIVALIGPNGAGKSTLLKVIAGLLKPSAGRILLRGKDITKIPVHQRARDGIAFVIQGGAIFPSLTSKDHIHLASLVAKKSRRQEAPTLSSGVLQSIVLPNNERAGLLSGGQRQALSVATMMATSPSLLLCDEPSAGLAPALAHALIEQVALLTRQQGLPVLWVEQRLGDVLAIADRAVLLLAGKVSAKTHQPKEWLVPEVLSQLTLGKTWEHPND